MEIKSAMDRSLVTLESGASAGERLNLGKTCRNSILSVAMRDNDMCPVLGSAGTSVILPIIFAGAYPKYNPRVAKHAVDTTPAPRTSADVA